MDVERINELGLEEFSKWKTIVLIMSFSKWWMALIAIQSYIIFNVCITQVSFNYHTAELKVFRYVCDLCYFFDVVFTMSYWKDTEIRKLRFATPKNWFFIGIDIVSLIPAEIFYAFHYIKSEENLTIYGALIQNRLLRIYRIFYLESMYAKTARKNHQYMLLLCFMILTKTFLVAQIFSCIWVNLHHSEDCDPEFYNCYLWHVLNMDALVIHNWDGAQETLTTTPERLLALMVIFLGVILIYGYFYPYIFLISIQLNYSQAIYYDKQKKLFRLIKNLIERMDVRKVILQDFIYAWKSTIDLKGVFDNIPLALQKEIFTDIYWEAFSHSELLRSVSRSCKRSLALVASTNHYHSGEVLYFKDQIKQQMLFLIQGTVQIMAEENEKSPLLSFSSGTVFGELSLFLSTPSQAIVKCMSYCEFQILKMVDTAEVFKDYPKDKKIVFRKLQERLAMARYTQWRKTNLQFNEKIRDLTVESTVEDCVKWIKTQWSAVAEGHRRQRLVMKAIEEGQRIPSFHRTAVQPDIKIEFISNYLELIVLSDAFEEKKDAVCLRTNFPWSIDPTAGFLKAWFIIVLVVSFIPVIIYPLCTIWFEEFPVVVYELSFVVTGIFAVDLVLKIFTAVKTKHHIITQFSLVLHQRLLEPTFYLDFLAALPYQIYTSVYYNELKSYEVGLLLQPALLKFHVFVTLKVPLSEYMTRLIFLKNSFLVVLVIYLFTELIDIYYFKYDNLKPGPDNWVERFLEDRRSDFSKNYFVAPIKSAIAILSVPDFKMHPDTNAGLVMQSLATYFGFFLKCFFLGSFFGCYVVKIFSHETFVVLLKRIANFSYMVKLPKKTLNRLITTVKFQWEYNNGDNLSSEVPVIKSTSFDLRKQIYIESAYKTLKSCKFFETESLDLIISIMERSFMVGIPAGSLLVSCGEIAHTINIVHRGVCQVSSFLAKDTTAGLGWPFSVGPGYVFPLPSAMCGIPTPTAVVSLTDCELIVIHLNDLLTILMENEILKDVFDVIQELKLVENLGQMKPGLIGVKDVSHHHHHHHHHHSHHPVAVEAPQKKKRRFVNPFWHLRKMLLKETHFSTMAFYKKWEVFFTSYLIFKSITWPACFGILAYLSHYILPILVISKSIIVFNFFINFRAPYYNKIGILVSHPSYTFRNYFIHNFLIDMLSTFPLYSIVRFGIVDSMSEAPMWLVIYTFFQHGLLLVPITASFRFWKATSNSKLLINMLRIFVIIFIVVNLFDNFFMYIFATWTIGAPYQVTAFQIKSEYAPTNPVFLKNNTIVEYYIYIAYWFLSSINCSDWGMTNMKGSQLYMSLILDFIGTFFHFCIYCWITSNYFFTYLGEAIFQEKIVSLVKLLEFENADDKIIEQALSFYNYEWSKTRGENLKTTFERLPVHLHEELFYQLYRSTLTKSNIFVGANDSFYKILAKNLNCVYFNRGSVIIFPNEVKSDLYFLHKGKCFVYDWYLILSDGSLIGDIKGTGLMENKIYALTHVEMLKISANDFFTVINNFDVIEMEFFKTTENVENFLLGDRYDKSYYVHPVDSKDVLHAFGLEGKIFGFEDESYFEEINKVSGIMRKAFKLKTEEKIRILVIYPDTWKMKVYLYFLQLIAVLTAVVIPTLASFGSLTIKAFVVISALDICWFFAIVLTFFVGYIDKIKGDVITDFKFVARNYVKRFDGFFIDVLALIPFEIIYIIGVRHTNQISASIVSWLRVFRLLRIYVLLRDMRVESKKLKANHSIKYLHVLLYIVVAVILFANFAVMTSQTENMQNARNPHILGYEQFEAFVDACENVSMNSLLVLFFQLDFFASSNLYIRVPRSQFEILYTIFLAILVPLMKGVLISQVFSIMYAKGLAKFQYKSQVIALESFLQDRETSPVLIKTVLDYKFNLLEFSRSENMPYFLKVCPSYLKINIMKDLYYDHLKHFPLFENVNPIFLEQLLAKLNREIYFSGQLIVEQNDVDHRMYFIHKGEVYVIDQTKEKAYVEMVVGTMGKGEYFGEAPGLWFSIPHSYTIRARTLAEVLVLDSNDWMDLRRCFPKTALDILAKAKTLRLI